MGCTSNCKGPVDRPKTVFQVCAYDAIGSLSPVSMSIAFPPYLCKNTGISLGKDTQGVSSVCQVFVKNMVPSYTLWPHANVWLPIWPGPWVWRLMRSTMLGSSPRQPNHIGLQKEFRPRNNGKNCPSANQLSRATPHTGSYPLTNKHANDFWHPFANTTLMQTYGRILK